MNPPSHKHFVLRAVGEAALRCLVRIICNSRSTLFWHECGLVVCGIVQRGGSLPTLCRKEHEHERVHEIKNTHNTCCERRFVQWFNCIGTCCLHLVAYLLGYSSTVKMETLHWTSIGLHEFTNMISPPCATKILWVILPVYYSALHVSAPLQAIIMRLQQKYR
jgi:hypothetical protein